MTPLPPRLARLFTTEEHYYALRQVASNAARIAIALQDLAQVDSLRFADQVNTAAFALADKEMSPNFSWADEPLDWESVCSQLAQGILSAGDEEDG